MKLLLDTHAFIWITTDTRLLSAKVLALIGDVENQILISAVSAYEIEFKRPRDQELQRMPTDLDEAVALQDFEWLPITWRHAREAGRLPPHHGDPWDRLLIAQAQVESASLVSIDRRLSAYPVQIVW